MNSRTTLVHTALDDGVAIVTIENPPVNSISAAVRAALAGALEAANRDPDVRAIVLVGANDVFCGGAEVREFNTPAQWQSPMLPELNLLQDSLAKPLVAAIGGFALGGGLELALGCHWRVATAHAQLGLPEVKLGLMPGSGGTQRLPRLVALDHALDMMTTGRPVDGRRAAELGLVDEVTDADLLQAATAFARRMSARQDGDVRRVRDLPLRTQADAPQFLAAARERLVRTSRTPRGALEVLATCEAALRLTFHDALAFERLRFLDLLRSPEFKALSYAFFAEREARRIPGLAPAAQPRSIRNAAVIGAGTMGTGIALSLANAGLPVILIESQATVLDRALSQITVYYKGEQAKGRLTAAEAERRIALVLPGTRMEQASTADVVIEAVFEDMAVKQSVFREMDAVARPGAILATNTSTLDVNCIANSTSRPQDVVGLHFFSPANVMRLLEVVRCAATSDEVLATAMQLGKELGKVAVVSGVCDGFIGNRMLQKYLQQALFLLDEGATPLQVDTAMEAWGMAMGPFAVGDLAGLDIGWAVRRRRRAEGSPMRYSRIADIVCELGRLGRKTGKGWYRYEAGARERIEDPEVLHLLNRHRAEIGVVTRAISAEEIVQRLTTALANEGAAILEEGIALRASDIDAVWVNGYGFPASRGGPMFEADRRGLASVLEDIEQFRRGYQGDQWQLAPLLKKMVAEDQTFTAR
jgi:3-hydroxyacyl-CoA dehydrogenase